MITSVQTSLTLKDFLHLQSRAEQKGLSWLPSTELYCQGGGSYSQTLFGSEEARGGGVVVIELQQHVLQPISHSQRELHQLGVHACRNDWRRDRRVKISHSVFGQSLNDPERGAHVCMRQCSPGGVCVLALFPPGCIWSQRVGTTSRMFYCLSRTPARGRAESRRAAATAARLTAASSVLTRSKSFTLGGHSDAC